MNQKFLSLIAGLMLGGVSQVKAMEAFFGAQAVASIVSHIRGNSEQQIKTDIMNGYKQSEAMLTKWTSKPGYGYQGQAILDAKGEPTLIEIREITPSSHIKTSTSSINTFTHSVDAGKACNKMYKEYFNRAIHDLLIQYCNSFDQKEARLQQLKPMFTPEAATANAICNSEKKITQKLKTLQSDVDSAALWNRMQDNQPSAALTKAHQALEEYQRELEQNLNKKQEEEKETLNLEQLFNNQ